jgi:hypothetical protein
MKEALTMSDVRNSSVLLEMHIQSVWDKILRHKLARLDDAGFLWQLSLGEVLLGSLAILWRKLGDVRVCTDCF